jgi:rod shape-determining protein MreC
MEHRVGDPKEQTIKPLFTQGPAIGLRTIILLCLSLTLMVSDAKLHMLEKIRTGLLFVVTPIHWISDAPVILFEGINHLLESKQGLIDDNKRLRLQSLALEQQVQTLSALQAENNQLRDLLHASKLLPPESMMVAELVGVDADVFRHQIIINKGKKDNVFVGQPVLDAYGLMGQVMEVGPATSRVLLITDNSHALSVQNNRTGARAVVNGIGELDKLIVKYVADTTDIQKGDLLVSSGLDGRFPVGYPVAEVTHVVRDAGQPFVSVEAKPLAKLDRSRYVMLLVKKTGTSP